MPTLDSQRDRIRTASFDNTFDKIFTLPMYRRHRRALITLTRFMHGDTKQLRRVTMDITRSAVCV